MCLTVTTVDSVMFAGTPIPTDFARDVQQSITCMTRKRQFNQQHNVPIYKGWVNHGFRRTGNVAMFLSETNFG